MSDQSPAVEAAEIIAEIEKHLGEIVGAKDMVHALRIGHAIADGLRGIRGGADVDRRRNEVIQALELFCRKRIEHFEPLDGDEPETPA